MQVEGMVQRVGEESQGVRGITCRVRESETRVAGVTAAPGIGSVKRRRETC